MMIVIYLWHHPDIMYVCNSTNKCVLAKTVLLNHLALILVRHRL